MGTVKPKLYTQEFDEFNRDKVHVFKHELIIFGIKDECCEKLKDFNYTEDNKFIQCNACKKLFTWKRKSKKVGWWEKIGLTRMDFQ